MAITPSNPANDRAWAVAKFQEWTDAPQARPVNKARALAHYQQMAILAGLNNGKGPQQ